MSRFAEENDNSEQHLTVNELLLRMGKKVPPKAASDVPETPTEEIIAEEETSTVETESSIKPKDSEPHGAITEEFYRITDDFVQKSEFFLDDTPVETKEITASQEVVKNDTKKGQDPNSTKLNTRITNWWNVLLKSSTPAIIIVEIGLALVVGACIFFTFGELWQWNKIFATVASCVFTVLMVTAVMLIQQRPKISTMISSLLVSLLLSFLPLVLILQNA